MNNGRHPFDGQQYVVMGMTTRTWYDERVPIDLDEYLHNRAPRESSIVPTPSGHSAYPSSAITSAESKEDPSIGQSRCWRRISETT